MAKRSGAAKGSVDYVQIPETSEVESPDKYRIARYCLRGTLVVLVSVLAIITASIAGMGAVNLVNPIRAGCEVTTDFSNTCEAVFNEVSKRIDGQHAVWHDPHNNGTYAFSGIQSARELSIVRISGSASKVKYTDKVHMLLEPVQNGDACRTVTTSDSQVFSILDFATNFCNINDLYCSADECRPFEALTYTYSIGKCTDSTIASCYTV